jgi:acid phosphatase family membrane protein YuiD
VDQELSICERHLAQQAEAVIVLQEDPELEAIRQKRMAEMMAARGGMPVSFAGPACSRAVAVPDGVASSVGVLTAALIVITGSTWNALSRERRAARGSAQVCLGWDLAEQ